MSDDRPGPAGTALFDLDRTVTRLATWTRFVIGANGARPTFLLQIPRLLGYAIGHPLGLAHRDAYKAHTLVTLGWMDRPTLEAKAEAFVARIVAGGLRPGAVAAIRAHKARGDRLVLVSASVDLIAEPLGRALGFDAVIATRLAWPPENGAGHATLAGANCYGAEKLRRIAELGQGRPLAGPVYAYSDHVSDLDMLLAADQGFAVNPSAGLRRAARGTAIRVVDFNHPGLGGAPQPN